MASQPSSLQSPDLQTELNALLDKAIAISNELNLNNNEPSAFLTTTWTSTQINEYHQILEEAASKLSSSAVKFSLAINANTSSLSDFRSVTKSFDSCFTNFIQASLKPTPFGRVFTADLKSTSRSICQSIASLIHQYAEPKRDLEAELSSKSYLIVTGLIWDACDVVKKLRGGGITACSKRLETCLSLLNDVVREVEASSESEHDLLWDDLLSEDEEDQDEGGNRLKPALSEEDSMILDKGLVLLKGVRLLLKKIGRVMMRRDTALNNNPECMGLMDDVAEGTAQISAFADDLANAIDVPMNMREVASSAASLVAKAADIVDLAKGFSAERDLEWYSTCRKQLDDTLEIVLERRVTR